MTVIKLKFCSNNINNALYALSYLIICFLSPFFTFTISSMCAGSERRGSEL